MSAAQNAVKPKSSLMKKLAIVAAGLVVLLVAVYFVGTSGWFLKSVILPKASKAMNAVVTAEDASLSPFSAVKISGLKVQTTGAEPLLAVRECSVRYPSLFDLIGGKINLDEISLTGVQVNVIQNADGTSNLDPLLKAQAGAPTQKPPSAAGQAPQVYVKKLVVSDSTVRYRKTDKTGTTAAELGGINVTLEELGNGKTARLNLKSEVKFDQAASGSITGAVQAGLKGDFSVNFDSKLLPVAVNGGAEVAVTQAGGGFKDSAALSAALKCDWTPTAIKGVTLKFSQNGKDLAALTASGPFDASKLEGKLKAEITGVDRQLLNLAGARLGIDFNQTVLSANSEIELAQGGKKIALNGGLNAAKFSVTDQGQKTPEMDLQLAYNLTVDQPGQSALIQALTLTGVQNRAEVVRGTLSKPMKIEWGKASGAVDESAFDLAINNLNLADWRAFAAGTDPAGKLNLKLNLLSQNAGQKLVVDLTASLAGFAAKFGSNRIDRTDLTLAVKSTTENLAQTDLRSFELGVANQGQPVLKASGSGSFNSKTLDADIRTDADAFIPRLAVLSGRTNLHFAQGSLNFKGRVVQKNLNPAQTNNPPFDRAITGDLQVTDLTGKYDAYTFDRLAVAGNCDVEIKNDLATIRKFVADLRQAGAAGGHVEATGRYDLAKTNGQVTLKLNDLNENFLKSFAALLAPNKLERVSITAALDAQYDANGEVGAKGSAQVVNLLITDPQGQLPKTPMTAEAKLDVGLKNQIAEVRELNGAIKQGELSGGTFDVKGRFDLAKTNGQFSLKVVDLNQNALRPFLAKALGDRTLETISVNLAADARVDAAGESSVKGEFKLVNLLVRDPQGQFPNAPMTAEVKLDAGLKNQVAEVREFNGAIKQGQLSGGSFDVKGRFDLAKTNGQFSVKVVDLNQNALRPFLAKSLGDLTLETISLNITADTRVDTAGESSVKGEFKLANLLVRDPKKQIPETPLALQLLLDGSLRGSVVELRNAGLQLTPTARATNYVALTGKLDLTASNAIRGDLKLKADALDVTYYYDLFANRPAPAATASSSAPAGANVEPAAVTLPLTNFNFTAAIGRFFIREVAATNLAANLRIDGGRVDLSSLQGTVNGAPIQGKLFANLAVPGYVYDANLSVTKLPLTPMVDSFMPYAKDGLRGSLSCGLAIKGAGVTGRSLRQSLSGSLVFDVTNATIIVKSLIKPDPTKKSKGVGAFVNTLTTILNPVLNVVGTAVGMPNLEAEPFDISRMDLQLGGGNIDVRNFTLANSKIIIGSHGPIPIADDLMASPLNLPLEVSLSRQLAARFSIANAPTNATYVKLPDFVVVKGTLAKAEAKVNLKALTGTVLSEIGKRAVGGEAGNLLQGIGNILGGGTKAVTNAPTTPTNPSTNKPPTNAPLNNLLNDIFAPKPKN